MYAPLLLKFPTSLRHDAAELLQRFAPQRIGLYSPDSPTGSTASVGCPMAAHRPAVDHSTPWRIWNPHHSLEQAERADIVILPCCLHGEASAAQHILHAALQGGTRVLLWEYAVPERNLDIMGWVWNMARAVFQHETTAVAKFIRSGGVERLIGQEDARLMAQGSAPCQREAHHRYTLNSLVLDVLTLVP